MDEPLNGSALRGANQIVAEKVNLKPRDEPPGERGLPHCALGQERLRGFVLARKIQLLAAFLIRLLGFADPFVDGFAAGEAFAGVVPVCDSGLP